MAVYTHSNIAFAISTTVQNADLDAGGFGGLTYTNVAQVGSIGGHGITTNVLTYNTVNTEVALKAKGISTAGDPQIEVARDGTDAGQAAMRAAGAPSVKDSYAFKITLQDGTLRYLRGIVAGIEHPGGRNEDFDLDVYTLGLNQAPIEV